MSEHEANRSGSDLWIAAGVVVCLAVGASMTYWLTSVPSAGPGRPAAAVKSGGVQGDLMNAPPPPQTGAQPAPGSLAPTEFKTITTPAAENAEFPPVTFDTLASYYYEIPSLRPQIDPAVLKPEAAQKIQADAAQPAPKTPGAGATASKSKLPEQIPAPIKALNGKKVAVQGFMVPLRLEKGATKSFLLVKDTSLCCFGRMPRMNEWVSVKMAEGRATKFISDQPVTVFGVLGVGEELNENGEVLSVYRLDAEDVAGPLDL